MKYFYALFIITFWLNLYSIEVYGETAIPSAREIGIGKAGVTVEAPQMIYKNPSIPALIKKKFYFLSFSSLYSTSDFFVIKGGLKIPVRLMNFTVVPCVEYMNLSTLFKEIKIIFNLSREISDKLIMGVNFNLMYGILEPVMDESEQIHKNDICFNLDAGLYYKFNQYIDMGISVLNLNNSKLKFTDEEYDIKGINFISGLKVKIAKDFIFYIEYNLSEEKSRLRGGSEVIFHNIINVRGGISDNGDITIGAGLNAYNLKINYGILSHPELGVNHSVDIEYRY